MDKSYFNVWKFKQALELSETDPISASFLYEEYFKKYPKDYSGYPYYCANLIVIGQLDQAEKLLNYAEKEFEKDSQIRKSEKIKKIEDNIFFTRVKLLCYQEKYEELYKFFVKNYNRMNSINLNGAWFYVEKKLGKLSEKKRDVNEYLFRQITKYDENDFFDHIKKHLSSYNENVENPNAAIFEENFLLKEVVEEIKKYIPSDKRLLLGFYDDIYYFKYDGCGRSDKKLVNYFKVVCLHNSQDFITMYPVSGNENLPHIDLNYMKKEEPVKVKRISQIDKFNQKYNIKR